MKLIFVLVGLTAAQAIIFPRADRSSPSRQRASAQGSNLNPPRAGSSPPRLNLPEKAKSKYDVEGPAVALIRGGNVHKHFDRYNRGEGYKRYDLDPNRSAVVTAVGSSGMSENKVQGDKIEFGLRQTAAGVARFTTKGEGRLKIQAFHRDRLVSQNDKMVMKDQEGELDANGDMNFHGTFEKTGRDQVTMTGHHEHGREKGPVSVTGQSVLAMEARQNPRGSRR